MHPEDRRQFQRLKLPRPILASIDGESALLLDVGVAGAFVEHHGTLAPGEHLTLSFRWQDDELDFLCEVARTRVARPGISHTGVRFVDSSVRSQQLLRDMMATFVQRLLDAQRLNADGDHESERLLGTMGHARRSRSRGYVCYQLQDGAWVHEPTASPRQPPDGFTVPAFEDDDEIATLCRTYEQADEEGRNLIRLVAELSTAAVKA